MTTSRAKRPTDGDDAEARLVRENSQLRHAVDAHATIDQAIGVLIATHRLLPAAGFEVLREVSQHTNIKLHTVAEAVIAWALRHTLPEPVQQELDAAVQRRREDTPDGPGPTGRGQVRRVGPA
ncbi:ANTAR domain-containing protein [Streptomyces sp. NPDC091972]|uniref:ANTAR domain-containing protein n=1 Tax=Streptomyces sp. NPDC091972 TaxID=3366007 RepID=UPI0037F44D3C